MVWGRARLSQMANMFWNPSGFANGSFVLIACYFVLKLRVHVRFSLPAGTSGNLSPSISRVPDGS